jgi:hypothetical protein
MKRTVERFFEGTDVFVLKEPSTMENYPFVTIGGTRMKISA